MAEGSKTIQKLDDATRRLLSDLLGGDETHGFDIDSIYYTPTGWKVLEFCKAETVDADKSHPNRYAFNWKKFASLWAVAGALRAEFYVVNFDDARDKARVLLVEKVTAPPIPGKESSYFEAKDISCEGKGITTFAELRKWFRALNTSGRAPWESPSTPNDLSARIVDLLVEYKNDEGSLSPDLLLASRPEKLPVNLRLERAILQQTRKGSIPATDDIFAKIAEALHVPSTKVRAAHACLLARKWIVA